VPNPPTSPAPPPKSSCASPNGCACGSDAVG
jgi:hypothetical protein